MGGRQSKEERTRAENQKKIADANENRKSLLRESAASGWCFDICCMKNPETDRLMCCSGIGDMCNCCTSCWNGKLLSCCEFDCSIPTCCKCMWCDECCGDYKNDDDSESESLVNKKKVDGEGASKDDEDEEELWTGRRNRRLTTYYKDNYYSGQTKF
jgi:hypothetical protein